MMVKVQGETSSIQGKKEKSTRYVSQNEFITRVHFRLIRSSSGVLLRSNKLVLWNLPSTFFFLSLYCKLTFTYSFTKIISLKLFYTFPLYKSTFHYCQSSFIKHAILLMIYRKTLNRSWFKKVFLSSFFLLIFNLITFKKIFLRNDLIQKKKLHNNLNERVYSLLIL
jgi:hypothetical protein